jgi:predicted ATP-dependent endonuclease of OLD family
MKINKVEISNFRSVQHTILDPGMLCALVGENNSGKSNVLQAINLVLGESWPSVRQITDDDVYNKDVGRDIEIKIWFDQGFQYPDATGRVHDVKGFLLRYSHYKRKAGIHVKGDPKLDFLCIDDVGNEIKVIKKLPKPGSGQKPFPDSLYVTSEFRDAFPVVFIGVNRDLKYHLSGSQWTLFGKLLKEIEQDFLSDDARKDAYALKMAEISGLLRTPLFKTLEDTVEQNVKKQTGFKEAGLSFKEPPVLAHYKSLELNIKESDAFSEAPATQMGSGIQSAVVIALIQAYREMQKTGGILMIEEPEVYLHPHTRRFFYQLLHNLSEQGSQVFYTTHSVEFLDLSDYQSVAVVRKSPSVGTTVVQPVGMKVAQGTKKELKLLTEFDARRNELFFAKKVLLVEGPSEKYSLPIAFRLSGIDVNERGISIVDVESKEAFPFFIEILGAFQIPFVVLRDEDRNANNYNSYHCALNKKIDGMCSDLGMVAFSSDPDFEGVLGTTGKDKIRQARDKMMSFSGAGQLPQILRDCIARF